MEKKQQPLLHFKSNAPILNEQFWGFRSHSDSFHFFGLTERIMFVSYARYASI